MNTCKSCKYWNVSYKVVNQRSDCDYPNTITAEKNRAGGMEIEADAADDTNLSAVLMTGQDFGCVCFTEKTKKSQS